MAEPILDLRQDQLLITLVEAFQSDPSQQHQKFLLIFMPGGYGFIKHSSLRGKRVPASQGDLEILERAGFIILTTGSKGSPLFTLTPEATAYYRTAIARRPKAKERARMGLQDLIQRGEALKKTLHGSDGALVTREYDPTTLKHWHQDCRDWLENNVPSKKALFDDFRNTDPTNRSGLNQALNMLERLQGELVVENTANKGKESMDLLQSFIVHGRDEAAKLELKDYLQNTLGLPEPTILHQQPNRGRTIIEKFEESSENIDVAFVLLTPDDLGGLPESEQRVRARQNVVFELGFFVGHFGRRTGRVILLHRGILEIPSDLSGVAYIDISKGIGSAGEQIRKELQGLEPWHTVS